MGIAVSLPRGVGFGFLVLMRGADGDYTTTTNSWDSLYTHDGDKSVTLRAQNVKVPLVLGTVITTISG
jgi:hypothetical protein